MGVQLYLLDRRQTVIVIANKQHLIGTLRRSWKLTEMDEERAAEIVAAEESIKKTNLPAAAMVAEIVERPLLGASLSPVAAHIVIGWEPHRYSVTDFGWDFLPVLGFAVRPPGAEHFILHEEQDGGLIPLTATRAVETSILDGAGRLVQAGQPPVAKCVAVKSLIPSYAIAECELADGRSVELVTELSSSQLPPLGWYVGKKPSETKAFSIDDATSP